MPVAHEFEHPVGVPVPEILLAGVLRAQAAQRSLGIDIAPRQFGRWRQVDREAGEVLGGDDDVLVRVDAVIGRW